MAHHRATDLQRQLAGDGGELLLHLFHELSKCLMNCGEFCDNFGYINYDLLGFLYLWVLLAKHDFTILNDLGGNSMNVGQ